MIVIRKGELDVESVKKEFSEDKRCFQYFNIEKDGSLYPIDHHDVAGETVKVCIEDKDMEDTFYHLEYESIIYGTDKAIHVFQGHDFELLIKVEKDEYSFDIHSLDLSIYREGHSFL